MQSSSTRQNAKPPAPRMLDNFHVPSKRFLDPLDEATLAVRAVCPDMLESWETPPKRFQEMFAPFLILDIGLMDQHVEDQAYRINEQIPFTTVNFLSAVIVTPPLFDLFSQIGY
jgi:hypothetical protein